MYNYCCWTRIGGIDRRRTIINACTATVISSTVNVVERVGWIAHSLLLLYSLFVPLFLLKVTLCRFTGGLETKSYE